MTGYVEGEPGKDPWERSRRYREVNDELRIRYESQGNLAVQTVVLLTSVEGLMEKTNILLGALNTTLNRVLDALNQDAVGEKSDKSPSGNEGSEQPQ